MTATRERLDVRKLEQGNGEWVVLATEGFNGLIVSGGHQSEKRARQAMKRIIEEAIANYICVLFEEALEQLYATRLVAAGHLPPGEEQAG